MTKPSAARMLLFGLVVTALLLVLANGLIEWLEARGDVDTLRPDDVARYLDRELFQIDNDGWITTTPYAEAHMLPARLRVEKGDTWRMFIVGESFAQGVPFVEYEMGRGQQRARRELPGGLPWWVRTWLTEAAGSRPVEVVDAAVAGQTSHRVSKVAEQLVRLEPDVLVVATGNNEGVLPPSEVAQRLHKLGGYRLLVKLLSPPTDPAARTTFTLQDADAAHITAQFHHNVEAILAAAQAAKVPVLLATLPVNLRYTGAELTHMIERPGGATRETEGRLPESECVAAGRRLYDQHAFQEAVTRLSTCDDVAAALRWIGLSHAALGQPSAARQALEHSVELAPYNRCRPSFNRWLREVATTYPGVTLVDMQGAVEAASPQGLPGPELFIDSCHMYSGGYAVVARAIVDALAQAGLGPFAGQPALRPAAQLAQAHAVGPRPPASPRR